MRQGTVRVRLDVNDVQAGMLLRAAGARRFAPNWAVAKIKANATPVGRRSELRDREGRSGATADLLHPGEGLDRREAGRRALVR
jgi:hypothetical protein